MNRFEILKESPKDSCYDPIFPLSVENNDMTYIMEGFQPCQNGLYLYTIGHFPMNRFEILKNDDLIPYYDIIEKDSGDLSELFKTAVGRKNLATAMSGPLQQRLEYSSIARRILMVDNFSHELPIYDRNSEYPGFHINTLGEIHSSIRGSRYPVPYVDIPSNAEIRLVEIKEANNDTKLRALIEKIQDKLFLDIANIEATHALTLLDGVINSGLSEVIQTPELTIDILSKAFHQMERFDLRVANIFMGGTEFEILRRWDQSIVDLETLASRLHRGLFGSIWGAQINVFPIMPRGTVYLTAEPAYVGHMPIRSPLSVILADNPFRMRVGWGASEQAGFYCNNPRGIAKIQITTD